MMSMRKSEVKSNIIIVGDLFPTKQNLSYFIKGDVKSLFEETIVKMFADADFAICNMEGALTDHRDRCMKTGPVKVAPTSAINAYIQLGVDCCMLANNHTTDGGHQGLLDMLHVINDSGMNYIGAGRCIDEIARSFVEEIGGMKIGFYNVSETMYNRPTKMTAGVWLYDEYIVCRELEQLKKICDYLIVIYHGGIEKFHYPSPELRKRFHRMADNGADMILAQHSHCIGCEEYYNGSYLLYGQGDFLLKNFAPGFTDSGLIIELVIESKNVQINKYLVNSSENMFVRYNVCQDLTELYQRSIKLADENYVYQQFQEFCDKELGIYLTAFKSPARLRKKIGKWFPKIFEKWLLKYNERDIMFTLHTLRSEQNRETAIMGLEHLLKNEMCNK